MQTRREEVPHDRLTRLCAAMTDALHAHPEYTEDVRCVVMLQDAEMGGLQIDNYDEHPDEHAVVDVLMHLKAIFASRGQELQIHPIAGNPKSN